jgi:hypothetical protein
VGHSPFVTSHHALSPHLVICELNPTIRIRPSIHPSIHRNCWSSVGYANFMTTFPGPDDEPDWEAVRKVRKQDIEPLMLPRSLLPHQGGKDLDDANQSSSTLQDFGETSLESIHEWESHRIRTYLLQFVGISEKSIACLLLYKLRRVDFAVDANVLRIFTRLGRLTPIGLLPREGSLLARRTPVIVTIRSKPLLPPWLLSIRSSAHNPRTPRYPSGSPLRTGISVL